MKKKPKTLWVPRGKVPIPPNKAIKGGKDYDRKREKSIEEEI